MLAAVPVAYMNRIVSLRKAYSLNNSIGKQSYTAYTFTLKQRKTNKSRKYKMHPYSTSHPS